jgi:hypothetical protein
MIKYLCIILLAFSSNGFSQIESLQLNLETAERLSTLPFDCIEVEYPNKLNQVLTDSTHLARPTELHPVFYGCFDWHSAVHGHWLLAKAMNSFPDSELAMRVVTLFDKQFTVPNVQKELIYFQPKLNNSFERTYGWAWILKLQAELKKSPYDADRKWSFSLQSLIDFIVTQYKEFLPKLVYPIRVGEHTNTAFGMSLALDYSRSVEDKEFESLIIQRSKEYYMTDEGCPIDWEPSGFDFLSPCLQEAELMSKILSKKEFGKWVDRFMPELKEESFELEPGKVLDRTDGKLVHLDGLNFSRAWCLYRLAAVLLKNEKRLVEVADAHIRESINQVVGSDYMGSHWLASFLLYALENRESLSK